MKKRCLKQSVKPFSVEHDTIDTSNISGIYRCLMKKTWYKIMFGLIKEMFIVLSVCTQVSFGRSLPPKEATKCLTLKLTM